MKKELKEKLAYWAETLMYLGGLAFGFSMVVGGFYALYTVIRALIG
jgi:uncharacterized membrane protein YedE/YeeE